MWDVDFQTAVAQAEIEDREIDGRYHHVRFPLADGSGTSRSRRRDRADPGVRRAGHEPVGRAVPAARRSTAFTPLFGAEVPIVAHELPTRRRGPGSR